MAVLTRVDGNIGYAELDGPPVNAIGHAMRQDLLAAIAWAEAEALDRVILSGRGRAFAAGADAREFDTNPVAPHLPDVLNALEATSVPWIAVINGVALGGGAEIAMACRMRIMSPGAQIGLPEVTLGVIPGAGGTQRLPRLVGLPKALSMIVSGRPVTADAALEAGLVHAVDPDAMAAAKSTPLEQLHALPRTRDLPPPEPEPKACDAARTQAMSKSRGQTAPLRAIECVEFGLTAPFETALQKERATFLELRHGDQARALRHVFFSERGAKLPARLSSEIGPPSHVAVVGGGTMGAGIAYANLNAGLRVTLLETDADRANTARQNVEKIIAASEKRGLIDAERATDIRVRLVTTADYADAAGAELAIEAAFEDMAVKQAIFAKLEAALSQTAILATNTSYLDVNQIAAGLADPSRVLGLHFFAPAHIMKLLEIVEGDETGDHALSTGFALAKSLRKIPVLAGVCDGFIGNRIFARYREAADMVLMDGATPWAIDAAMKEFGYAMGPYETQDLSGLDIGYANRRRQDATRDPNRRYVPIADRMVEQNRLGRKTGKGWYLYPEGGSQDTDPSVVALVEAEAAAAGVKRVDYTADQIRMRLLAAMINEAAGILQDGIAQSASDIDLVTIHGYGFPRWRGGLMHYGDSIGAKTLLAELEALAKEDPEVWAISPLLRRCAETGTALADAAPD